MTPHTGDSSALTIDAEFERLIPALRPEEFNQLEANILRDGCQEPPSLSKTDGKIILLDGRNRFVICEKHGKNFEIVLVELTDRNQAKLWLEERQLGRRKQHRPRKVSRLYGRRN